MSSAGRKRKSDNEEFERRQRERQARVEADIRRLATAPAAREYLDTLAERWALDSQASSFEDHVLRAFGNFDLDMSSNLSAELDDRGSFGLRTLDERINDHEMEAVALYSQMRGLRMFPLDSDCDACAQAEATVASRASPPAAVAEARVVLEAAREKQAAHARMTKVLEMIYYAKRVVLGAFQAKLAVHQLHVGEDAALDADLDARLGSWALRFRWRDTNTNDNQKLLLHLLDCAMEKRYRKSNGWCYEPVVVDGHNTHAWRAVCEIAHFVHGSIHKETAWEQWCYATASLKTIPIMIEYLQSCRDHQFPDLAKRRGVYSFRNGVYLAHTDSFRAFEEVAAGDCAPLADDVVACKFMDAEFLHYDDLRWQDVPTPHFQSILDFQEFGGDVSQWMYVLLGRLIYELNEMDSWQVIPFLKGMASSGKSTVLLKVAKNLFEAIDVGVLSNNVEKKFGLR